ncbi:MAG: hypothetical protein M3Q48_17880, partial [Actinomycetota bacterium]|nr:hypothetical protein [Actinomycetota bacterium]
PQTAGATAVGEAPPARRAGDDVVRHVRRRQGQDAQAAAVGGAIAATHLALATSGAEGNGAAHLATRGSMLAAALLTTALCATAARRAGAGARRGWMLGGGPRLVDGLASTDPDHPLVPAGLTTLATVPVRTPDGNVFATLCAADAGEGRVRQTTVVLLELFAALVVEHVRAVDQPQPVLA